MTNAAHSLKRSAFQLGTCRAVTFALDIESANGKIRDPSFGQRDRSHIESLGYSVPESTEEAREDLVCSSATLVFAPYLPYPIIEYLFERNWSPDRLMKNVMNGTPLEGWLDDK